ncbi:MAG: hypothetical protein LBT40_16760 [Deltaproteobacteria bacterium]|nr:hypothetical protein [Deltaproteobacteria bacterium]
MPHHDAETFDGRPNITDATREQTFMSRFGKVHAGSASEDEAADVDQAFAAYVRRALPGALHRQAPGTAPVVGLAAEGGDTPVKAMTGEQESGRVDVLSGRFEVLSGQVEVLSVRITELSTRIGYFLTFMGIIFIIFVAAFVLSFRGVNQRIDKVEARLETLGDRVTQMHLQMREDIVRLQTSMELLLRASGLHLEPAKPSNEPVDRASPGESSPPTAGPAVPPSD